MAAWQNSRRSKFRMLLKSQRVCMDVKKIRVKLTYSGWLTVIFTFDWVVVDFTLHYDVKTLR